MSDTYWATSLIVQANKLSAQAHRLRAIAREKRRRARNLAKDGLIPQCDLDALLCEGLALMQQADQLHDRALPLLIQAMRLRARLVF
jgi:hypothetical protein